MPLELSTIIARTANLMVAPVDEELVLLSLERNQYLALNVIGRRIWDLLETPQCITAVCEQLHTEFDATFEQITADVVPFIHEMLRDGLIYVVDGSSG